MKKILLFCSLLFLVFGFSACEEGEDPKAELVVTVKDASGATQSGAEVTAMNQVDDSSITTATTGSNGKATLEIPGSTLVTVVAIKGSKGGSTRITNFMDSGKSYTINVTIQ